MKQFLTVVLIFLICGAATGVFYYQSNLQYGVSQEIQIQIDEGEGFYSAIRKLRKQDEQVSFRVAKMYLKLNELEKALKAGEYVFSKGSSLESILNDFASGNVVKYKVVIPEGYNLYEIADILEKQEIVKSAKNFITFVKSKSAVQKHLKYSAESLEGYLYPATYEFSKNMEPSVVVSTLVAAYKNNFSVLKKDCMLPEGFGEHKLVTLASVVEKETGASQERPLIASVFWNRLRKKMRLQSDPTTIYGQWVQTGKRLFNIRKKHLLEKNAYNTYAVKALPIGPISNPGFEALKAVCKPAVSDYLYFVSKNDGTHYFSKTYKEHTNAVRRFQLSRKARAGKSWRDLKSK